MMSQASWTNLASPRRMSPLGPLLRGASMPPGTAKTSLPCSKAHLAVMSDPLDWVPSTTSTPRLSPAMSRLRTGK